MSSVQALKDQWAAAGWTGGFRAIIAGWESSRALKVATVLAVTLLAAGLRLFKLGEWSFWIDEPITLERSQDFLNLEPQHWSITRLLTFVSFQLFGVSEWTARLPSAIIGILTVPILYFLIRRIWRASIGALAVALLAVSTWHIYWSQNARFYAALLLFYTVGILLFHLGLEEDSRPLLIGSIVMFGLAVQERLVALLFLPVVAAYFIGLWLLRIERPPGINRGNLILFGIPAVMIAIALPLLLPAVRQPLEWLSIFGYVNTNPFWILVGVAFYIGIPIMVMAAAGAIFFMRRKDRAILLMFMAAVVPLAVIMLVSLVHFTANRYLFEILPFWLILAGVATVRLIESVPASMKIIPIGVALLLVLSPMPENFLYYSQQNGNRDDWKGAFGFIEERMQPSDTIVVRNLRIGRYYLGDRVAGIQSVDLSDIAEGENRIWFVEDRFLETTNREFLKWIQENARLMSNLDVHVGARNFKMRVFLYDPADLNLTSYSIMVRVASRTEKESLPAKTR